MKKIVLKCIALTLTVAMLLTVAGCGEKEPEFSLTLTTVYGGATVSMENAIIESYMQASDDEALTTLLKDASGKPFDYSNIIFTWERDGSYTYTVHVAENEQFTDAVTYETTTSQLHYGVFMPGKTYWWKVTSGNGGESAVDSFTVKDDTVRYISLQQARNVRDIGGWQTEDGKRVKYGMIYRGGKINPSGGVEGLSELDLYVFRNVLGIKSEVDLRTPNSDDGGQNHSVFGYTTPYLKAPITGYTYILPSFEQTEPIERKHNEQITESLKQIFEHLADEQNYPLYFHCNAGADRTGTLAFLINGVLGVSREDLTRDFELTSFSKYGKRYRSKLDGHTFDDSGVMQDDSGNYVAWDYMIDRLIDEYGTGGGSLSAAIENYLVTACDIEQTTIDQIHTIMLEE